MENAEERKKMKKIEKEEQLKWLQAAGVDVAQGYLFGCALPLESFMQRFLQADKDDASL